MDSFQATLAALSSNAYVEGRHAKNLTPLPTGATRLPDPLGYISDPHSGFEASAYLYNGQVVIAFAGTLPGSADIPADALLGLGIPEQQLKAAAEFYQRVKQTYGDNVVFTGHSLGGGLAALMGVFFDKQAVTFDPAPFRLVATEQNAQTIANHLASEGFLADADLAGYTTTESTLVAEVPSLIPILLAAGVISPALAVTLAIRRYPTVIRGEARITAIAAEGEFLTAGFAGLGDAVLDDLRIKNAAVQLIEHGGVDTLGLNEGIELHSINLLTAFLLEPTLAEVSQQLPDLVKLLLDESLYARTINSSESDILVQLLRNHYTAGSDEVLTRFATDLQRLGAEGSTRLDGLHEGILATIIERYYFANASSTDSFLSPYGNGVRFDLSEITASDRRGQQRLITSIGRLVDPAEVSRATTGASQALLWTVQRGANGLGMRVMGGSAVVRTHNPVLKSLDLSTSQCA